ncbi:hypothetical protein [Polaromonas hydrogenivorans]|uniref:Nucleotidyltransferase n=1 Tax=Polaromonas hydrogenivorans TaxID=335476 RepID=A0AAU7LUG1_9BURK
MGGNALKSIQTHRLDAGEYHALVPKVLEIIRSVVGDKRPLCVIDAYRAKPDFGDMDVLVGSNELRADYKDLLEKEFKSREVYRNGAVTSFDFDGFQIDLIAIPNEKFDYVKSYFSWNDLGNLVGRVAHKMGLKHGFEGLYFPLRAGSTHLIAEINITLDVSRALTFMGYDPVRFAQGFDTLEDIFRFTASSPYFNPAIYLFENVNAASRVRDIKRKTYTSFLKWLSDPQGLQFFKNERPEIDGSHVFPQDKSVWIAPLRAEFPDFGDSLDQALFQQSRSEAVRAIFNGERVAQLTGLSGKSLGNLMGDVRNSHGNTDAWVQWVLSVGQAGVDAAVMQAARRLSAG